MSKMRNRKKPATAPVHPTPVRNSVSSMPITSSTTTSPGSVRPKCRSATLPDHEPTTKRTTIAVA